jgi:hypothetical protein
MQIKEHLKRGALAAAGQIPDALMVAGAASISVGAGMVYTPAGFIVGGVFLLLAGWLTAKGAK